MGKEQNKHQHQSNFLSGFFGLILKIIFSAIFIILALLVTLFAISYIGYSNNVTVDAWKWASKIPLVTDLYNNIIVHYGNQDAFANTGMTLILIGLDVFLIYFGIMFIIKKIPLIGKVIKWLTGIIPSLSIIAIIIGVLLIVVV